jgi:methionyl-tRNA synthetase
MNKKFYITGAIPYVNSSAHVGHALEFVETDVIARYHKLLGEDVATLSGGDENALKNVQAAENAGVLIQEFVDKNTESFRQLAIKLNAEFTFWQKGSDQKHHFPSSQKLWKLCDKAGDIYKKKYEGLYCVGCEQFYIPQELNKDGECLEHPGKPLQKVSEENYFFRLSKYQDFLVDLIEKDKLKIYPAHRKNEVLSFLKDGLNDISISRSNERAKNWGVPVPGDPTQREYVWLDALQIYETGVGFGWDEKLYKKWWPADLHVIGKGIIRFHAVYWPAFLHSAGLETPKALFVHDYFTVNGQKMSKTLGNVIDPIKIIDEYGVDALRYYLLAKFSPFSDGDFSEEKLKDIYNSDLANGIGNLVSRVCALANGKVPEINSDPDSHPLRIDESIHNWKKVWKDIDTFVPQFQFDKALSSIWKFIREADKYINTNEPWKLAITDKEKFNWVIYGVLDSIHQIAWQIYPFLPETSTKIARALNIEKLLVKNPLSKDSWTNIKPGTKIDLVKPLFPRLK